MLTNTWNYDKVNKLSTNSKSVEKKIWKNLKKFLTNQKQHDKINKLSQRDDSKTTLITKQWNTYDSRKFLTNHHSNEWTFYNSNDER